MRVLLGSLLLASLSLAGPTVRGQRDLAQALRAALGDATEVLVVVDATPYVRGQTESIGIALQELGRAGRFRLAALGERPGPAAESSGALTPQLANALGETRRHASTFDALRRTLGSVRGGAVVYLADWHFEDDEHAEAFLKQLRGRGVRFSVVGSEAAFTRGWLDGFTWTGEADQPDRIGKNPWRTGKKNAPWHGGDTAYPHLPHRFSGMGWETEFARPPSRADEALKERLGEEMPAEDAFRRYPLPSAFGPYALSRVCAETGGRYVLWSWNRSGRAQVTYDYGRCELFAPDLRSRAEIRSDVARRPIARALNRAWHALLGRDVDAVGVTPTLAENHATGQAMESRRKTPTLSTSWLDKNAHAEFLRRAESTLGALADAIRILDEAIGKAPEQPDPVDRRYVADAELLSFILAKQRFELEAAVAIAKDVPDDAWKDDTFPALQRATAQPAPIHARQKALAQRLRGTPFGEQIRRNEIRGWKLTTRQLPKKPTRGNSGGSPAFSDRDEPPTTPSGGGSGGSGPSSG